jgi:hypothetical protein
MYSLYISFNSGFIFENSSWSNKLKDDGRCSLVLGAGASADAGVSIGVGVGADVSIDAGVSIGVVLFEF